MRPKLTKPQLKALELAYKKIDGLVCDEPNSRPLKQCVKKGLIGFSPTGWAYKTPMGATVLLSAAQMKE
jgi:hypothetical protein